MKSYIDKFWNKALGNNDPVVMLAKHALDEMQKNLEAAVLAAQAEEREACAKFVSDSRNNDEYGEFLAAAIRARGMK